MERVRRESAERYLESRLGKINEQIKIAYLCGKRIMVVITDEAELVTQLISRESLIGIKTSRFDGRVYDGYDTIEYVDDNGEFIKSNPEKLECEYPTLYVSTSGSVPYKSLINYARHFYGVSSFRDPELLKHVDRLKKSIILLIMSGHPDSESEDTRGQKEKGIPSICQSLTEYVTVPFLGENELKGIVSEWLHDHEGLQITRHVKGYARIGDEQFLNRMYQAMRALSPGQIRSSLKRCRIEFGKVYHTDEDPELTKVIKTLRQVTEQKISKSSALSLIDTSGAKRPDGLDNIMQWLEENQKSISEPSHYASYEMTPPKGILISGIPGSGKSMLAKYIAAQLKLSLVRLDLGDALGRYVGDSEKGFKTALEVAEALSPCVLWIDEMEKMFEGGNNSGNEVTRRLIGKFLTWMQEKAERGASCFVYATANDISKMPPEMFRTGRFDKKFYTFMPGAEDCAKIFDSIIKGQNAKYSRGIPHEKAAKKLFNEAEVNGKAFLKILSEHCLASASGHSTDGEVRRDNKFFIGSDIEQLVLSAKILYLNRHEESDSEDAVFGSGKFKECLTDALKDMKTYGETNLEQIALAFSQIARNNFSPASSQVIMPTEGYDETAFRNAYRRDPKTDRKIYSIESPLFKHEYDRRLLAVVSRMLNSLGPEIAGAKV